MCVHIEVCASVCVQVLCLAISSTRRREEGSKKFKIRNTTIIHLRQAIHSLHTAYHNTNDMTDSPVPTGRSAPSGAVHSCTLEQGMEQKVHHRCLRCGVLGPLSGTKLPLGCGASFLVHSHWDVGSNRVCLK